MPKRGNSEGSITRLTDGRWQARVTLPDGRRKAYYGKTRKEAAAKLAAALGDLRRGLPLPSERQSVGTFLERWLRDSARRSIRPATFSSYGDIIRLHLVP